MDVVNKYGADSLRYYLLSSPSVRAQGLNFSEKGVDEVMKKVVMKLGNVISFFEMYSEENPKSEMRNPKSSNVLDQWIVARLDEVILEVGKRMDAYELDRASWPILDFIEDLSTWYLRRSRDRFKGDDAKDKNSAIATTRFILCEFSKIIAPFMPFLAEDIYQKVKGSDGKESVHLETWPTGKKAPEKILEAMKDVRSIVTLGLEARAKALIKVRQPLAVLKIKNSKSEILKNPELVKLIQDEINIKEVLFDEKIETEVWLDTAITPALQEEGDMRELVRMIQGFRKDQGLDANQKISLSITADTKTLEIVQKFKTLIQATCGLSEIEISEGDFLLAIEKL